MTTDAKTTTEMTINQFAQLTAREILRRRDCEKAVTLSEVEIVTLIAQSIILFSGYLDGTSATEGLV